MLDSWTLSTGFAAVATTNITTSSSFIRIVRDTRYSGTLGCANLKDSQVPEVARAAEKRTAPFRGDWKKRTRLCVCVRVYVLSVCVKERERERERRTESGKKSVWRLLHVNCTSSGALVDPIPGTCWSAIHMTVPCCLIIPPQARRRDFWLRETVSVGKHFSNEDELGASAAAASVINAYNLNRARSHFLSVGRTICDELATQDLVQYKDEISEFLIVQDSSK